MILVFISFTLNMFYFFFLSEINRATVGQRAFTFTVSILHFIYLIIWKVERSIRGRCKSLDTPVSVLSDLSCGRGKHLLYRNRKCLFMIFIQCFQLIASNSEIFLGCLVKHAYEFPTDIKGTDNFSFPILISLALASS